MIRKRESRSSGSIGGESEDEEIGDAVVASPRKQLMWEELKQRLAKQERAEVKRILGPDIIRKNSTLLREGVALQDMLRQFREDNEDRLRKMSLTKKFMTLRTPIQLSLKRQITHLVEKLRKLDMLEGRKRSFVDAARDRTEPTHENIVSFLEKEVKRDSLDGIHNANQRRSKVRSAHTAQRPGTPSSRIIDSLDERWTNMKRIEMIADLLRDGLAEETRSLETWIAELNAELESEAAYVADAREAFHASEKRIPSTSDLRSFKKRLESEWIMRESLPPVVSESTCATRSIGAELQASAFKKERSPSSSVPEASSSRGRSERSDSKLRSKLEGLLLEARYLS